MTMVHTIGKCTATLGLYFAFIALYYPVFAEESLEIEVTGKGEIGTDASLNCSVSPETAELQWLFKETIVTESNRTKLAYEKMEWNKDLDGNIKNKKIYRLKVANVTIEDAGNYTCVAKLGEVTANRTVNLDLRFPGRLVNTTDDLVLRATSDLATPKSTKLHCVFEVYQPNGVAWYNNETANAVQRQVSHAAVPVGPKRIESTYLIPITTEDSGVYICETLDNVTGKMIQGKINVIVQAPPQITNFSAIPINTTQLYIAWTVKNYNCTVESYTLMVRELHSNSEPPYSQYVKEKIAPNSTSFVIKGLNKSTEYQLKLEVKTQGWTKRGLSSDNSTVKTLSKEPVFVPNISINGFSATSVTIGWPPPPEDIADLIHYYEPEARKKDSNASSKTIHPRDNRNLPYMFDNLEPHSTYVFRVRACSYYSGSCGNWSEKMEAATLDGIPGKPSNVTVNCDRGYMNMTWDPPEKPNAEIKGYTMELTGNATYKDRYGTLKEDMWGPLSRFMTNDSRSARFDDLQPNSHYTVRVSAMTRTRRRGHEETRRCSTRPKEPDAPPRPRWRKIIEDKKYMFKVYLPRVTERNGPICCYRVHMVRMHNTDWASLPSPDAINIIEYEEAHGAQQTTPGAYITDIFSNDWFPSDSELIMGDDNTVYNTTDPTLSSDACSRCRQRPRRVPHDLPVPSTSTTTVPTTTDDDLLEDTTGDAEEGRARRSLADKDYNLNAVMRDKTNEDDRSKDNEVRVKDGQLDTMSNYTLFVELIPGLPELKPMYSEYVNALTPAPSPTVPVPATALEVALQVTCGVAGAVLLLMVAVCALQARRARKLPPHAPLEMNRIEAAFRTLFGGRQHMMSATLPDIPPIAKEDLAVAYAERQVDSDYGFQKEFELLQMLPECFPDRTTHASEARENQPKNRYPDIKAYDQTRVKLAQIDSITGSDYINANYVSGYRDRKQFICAQGPTDTTVTDFWRMIWEHGLELIVMLTNLEEYSKVKCSKYWPDEVRGSRAFGAITVHHVAEKRYSDYIVRELKITKQPTNSDGQPIVENNGVAKRNGDCKEASESSAPTSPREAKDCVETRTVRQYHFLMWKDFAAPEHPHSILKFIKRVNEAWANTVGPVVVHCSAGVGRTGTLVALDCLLEQLKATGQASVFNTVAELRRQRNFLVQSLKQYVFVYRALVEYAHYGDTEIPASRLKASIDRLRNTPEGGDKCLMEHEFEKMINSPVAEPVKSCAAAASEEVRPKNRCGDCLPYDRNRVILTPLPGRDFSTYINASFIEAYDNSEGFIITQDPLPNTIMDFWRMASEHNVSTIVMLSEIGEGKCPRYWDDGTTQHEHIAVQYEESESCPYYTRRQFRVTNNKNGDTVSVRQLQYQGWPTAPGHVPEVTRGLAELADAARALLHHAQAMLVHCHLGTERSALFVALCILICQLRVERRVDVNSVARKVRSQRARTIDTFLQYEFLHRAILNYAELHNLLEDS